MKFNKTIFKKPSTYLFFVCVGLCMAMFLFSLVKICMFLSSGNAVYINIYQIIFSSCTLVVLGLYATFVLLSKLNISEILTSYFMLFLFVFIGVFNCFGLYSSKIALYIAFAFLGFSIALISVSIFFHMQKLQNGTLQAKPSFLVLFEISFSVFMFSIIEILVFLIAKFSNSVLLLKTIDYVIGFLCALCGICVVAVTSFISAIYGKKFLNMCLISQKK